MHFSIRYLYRTIKHPLYNVLGAIQELFYRSSERGLAIHPCNSLIECDQCGKQQKNRAFCYFCNHIQKTVVCGSCGMTKCMNRSPGGCLVKHGANYITGVKIAGAICDHCETFVCHGRDCIQKHGCACPLIDAVCIEVGVSSFSCIESGVLV